MKYLRENTFAGEQKTILNSVPDFSSSMSMTETIQKMKQDEEGWGTRCGGLDNDGLFRIPHCRAPGIHRL